MIVKGQKINDRYEVKKLIGEGGMANVYLAHDTILDRNVAVKVLRGDLADDEKFVRKFQREAISASSLAHPNIVEMYDVGEDNGKYFIVMEYIDGKTLKSLIKKRGALTVYEVIDIMKQLCDGIAYAHDSYIIHRDIKPQNIMILDNGLVKITDFGIATALNNLELTQTDSVMGSVHYLPPEQANGKGSTIKSDIYSLGIMMFELLTGKVPFKGENPVEIAIKHMKENLPSVTSMNPDIPQSIENIILKCCAKNPKNRYDNVREMKADLLTALDDEHKNDRKLIYPYSEQDLEETKALPVIKSVKEETEVTEVKKTSKLNKTIFIMTLICVGLCLFVGIAAIIYPKITEVKEVKVPDVTNMTVVEAEKKLKKSGFKVEADTQEKNSSDVEEGKVIGTNPVIGRSLKKGTSIKLIVSIGEKGMILEDYTGKNYYETKGLLEANEIYVRTEKITVDDEDAKENVIIKQSPEKGKKVVEGDTVTLYIPDIASEYPNIVAEGWSIDKVTKFCEDYNLTLKISYQETDLYDEGTIINQSRTAGTKLKAYSTLEITVSTLPTGE